MLGFVKTMDHLCLEVEMKEHRMSYRSQTDLSPRNEQRADKDSPIGTLIMPSNLPSLISEPRERLSMEWKRALKRVKEFAR